MGQSKLFFLGRLRSWRVQRDSDVPSVCCGRCPLHFPTGGGYINKGQKQTEQALGEGRRCHWCETGLYGGGGREAVSLPKSIAFESILDSSRKRLHQTLLLQGSIIQQLLNKIHVSQKHSPTTVPLQTQCIKGITAMGEGDKEIDFLKEINDGAAHDMDRPSR